MMQNELIDIDSMELNTYLCFIMFNMSFIREPFVMEPFFDIRKELEPFFSDYISSVLHSWNCLIFYYIMDLKLRTELKEDK